MCSKKSNETSARLIFRLHFVQKEQEEELLRIVMALREVSALLSVLYQSFGESPVKIYHCILDSWKSAAFNGHTVHVVSPISRLPHSFEIALEGNRRTFLNFETERTMHRRSGRYRYPIRVRHRCRRSEFQLVTNDRMAEGQWRAPA